MQNVNMSAEISLNSKRVAQIEDVMDALLFE